MNAIKVLLTVVIVGAVLAGGGYFFLHRTDVEVQVPPPPQSPATQAPRAPDYGNYATSKHPTFPGGSQSDARSKDK